MKKMILIFALILTFAVNGCAAVPDEVKKDIKNYHGENNNIDPKNFKFTYINTSDLKDSSQKAIEKNYKQFNISQNIEFTSFPEEINQMEFKYTDNFEENYIDILKMFFTQQELNSQEINLNSSKSGSKSYSFFNENNRVYGCVSDNGFVSMLKPDAFDISFSYNDPNIKIYHADRNEDLSDTYQLKNGSCSVKDAVDYINNWFKTNYKKIAPDYDYRVKTVIVRKHENYHLFEIHTEIFYRDIPLDNLSMEAETDEENLKMHMIYTSNNVTIQMLNVNQIDSFTNGTGILQPVKAEKIEECISLESALKFCETTFTDFRNITISDIGIKYTTSPDYDYINNQEPYAPGISVASRPVWEFIIDVSPSEFLREGEINTYGEVRKYIYIDILTGELHYNLDVVLQGMG